MLRDADDGRRDIICGNGDCQGTIGYELQGDGGFGYDPLFWPQDTPGKTMAELTPRARRPRRSAAEEPRCTAGPYCQIFVNKPLSGYNRVSL